MPERTFLTAEWRDLALLNFEIEPDVLLPHVPGGTEIDLWDGRCFVSVVGFRFFRTRLMGLPIPFHSNFLEVNLRFYVRREVQGELRRGVVFIKEIVPPTRNCLGGPGAVQRKLRRAADAPCR